MGKIRRRQRQRQNSKIPESTRFYSSQHMPSAHTLPPFIVDDGSGSIFFFFNLVNTYQTLLHSYLFREIELIRWHGFIVITTTFRYSSFYPYEFSVDHRYFNLRSLSTVIRLFAHTERKKKKKNLGINTGFASIIIKGRIKFSFGERWTDEQTKRSLFGGWFE